MPGPETGIWHLRWLLWSSGSGMLIIALAAIDAALALPVYLLWAAAAFVLLVYPYRSDWRAADAVTAVRVFLFLVASACALSDGLRMLVAPVMALAAVGDLLDGLIARRYGGGRHGPIVDMEADQLFVFALVLAAMAANGYPAWLLVFPGLKYAFTAVQFVLGVDVGSPQPVRSGNQRARWIYLCVVLLLLSTAVPGFTASWHLVLIALAALALAASFAGDIVHLLARRASDGPS
ncbi:MAG: CDP-alcohol phosphatidyltransferase family protein [Pseudomonadota bacterium]